MTWLKVDDGFYSHPKVLTIPRALRAEALGTWILCATWSADKLTDGHIPTHMVEELGGTLDGAGALADVRLWRRLRNEFVFVNWDEWQYTREQVEGNRKRERERKAAQRAGKPLDTADASANVPVGQTRDTAGTNGVSELPVQSSPVPRLSTHLSESSPVPETDEQPVDNSDGLEACATRYGFDPVRVRTELSKVLRRIPEDDDTIRVATTILSRAAQWPDKPTAFLVGSMRKNPMEAQQIAYGGAA